MALFSQEPVLRKVYLFFFVSGVSVLSALAFHYMIQLNQDHYLTIEQNERQKIAICLFVQQKIRTLQNQFQYMLLSSSRIELSNANKEIIKYVDEVKEAIDVIEKGGRIMEDIEVNFGNTVRLTQTFEYKAKANGPLTVSALEMRTNLARLEEMRIEYYTVMQRELGKPTKGGRLALYHKKIAPFFTRLSENSNRLYIESLTVYSDAETRRQEMAGFFNRASVALVPLFLLISGWIAWWTLKDIQRLMKERENALTALTETNENLESLVDARTKDLSAEVAERKHAQDMYSAQADFLTNVIESLDHPFYVINASDYTVSMSNRAAKKMSKGTGGCCYSLIFDRDKPCLGDGPPCPLTMVKEQRRSVVVDHHSEGPDGTPRHLEIHGYPIFNAQGEVAQMIEYSLDVTEKYLAQQELEQSRDNLERTVRERTRSLEREVDYRLKVQRDLEASERHFRQLIEGIQDIIVILDRAGNVTYISPSVESVLGYLVEEVVGNSFLDFVFIEERGAHKQVQADFFIKAMDSESPLEHHVIDVNGKTHVMESRVQDMFHEPAISGLLITSREITARKEAEHMQQRLDLVIEQSPSSVIITDINGNIEYVNPQFEKITGYSKEEVIGKNPSILNSGLTDPAQFKAMYAAIANGEVWQGEFINKTRHGELYTENVIVAPIKNELGEITKYVALKENITELKRAREQAESANKSKSEFLSRMSHELRTPLNAIIGFSKLLMADRQGQFSDKQAEQANRIHVAGKHLMQMISEILDFSRIETGNFSVNFETVDGYEVVRECLMLTEHMAQENAISMVVDDSLKRVPYLHVDRMRFKQVLVNLMTNGIKYNRPKGSVTISAEIKPGAVAFSIADTGVGIPEEKQEGLFTPFTRLTEDATLIEGTGIGMTIAKQLVEAMHGTIEFSSEVDKGTTFVVTLPCEQGALTSSAAAMTLDPGGPSLTVLYVDDDKDRIKDIRSLFGPWGEATLVVRRDSHKALRAIPLLKPGLVLAHESLVSQGELNFISQLKSCEGCPSDVVVFVLSENDGGLDIDEADGVLRLPTTLKTITDAYFDLKGKNDD